MVQPGVVHGIRPSCRIPSRHSSRCGLDYRLADLPAAQPVSKGSERLIRPDAWNFNGNCRIVIGYRCPFLQLFRSLIT
jgi:hypothetical protein